MLNVNAILMTANNTSQVKFESSLNNAIFDWCISESSFYCAIFG